MKEIDDVALYHYKLKLSHEDKLRRRFGRTQKQSDADAEDEATAALVQGVVNDISFGELIDGDAEDLAAQASASDGSSDYSSSDGYDSDESDEDEDGDDSEESSEGDKPPPPPPKSPRPGRPGDAPGDGHKSNYVNPTPRNRAITMRTSHSEAAASSISLDLGTRERLSIAQRLRNSKSMEMLRRGKSTSVDLPPPPPIPQHHQTHQGRRPKRSAAAGSTNPPQSTPRSSSGSLRPAPPTRGPPSPPKETTTATTIDIIEGGRNQPQPISNSTSTVGSQNSITTMTGEGSAWDSRTSLESDKNKPLPDPKVRVGLDPDRTPRMPQKVPDVTPKIGQKKPKLKKVVEEIKPPELTYIPGLLPIFVESVRGNISSGLQRLLTLFLGDRSFRITSLRPSSEVDRAVMRGPLLLERVLASWLRLKRWPARSTSPSLHTSPILSHNTPLVSHVPPQCCGFDFGTTRSYHTRVYPPEMYL